MNAPMQPTIIFRQIIQLATGAIVEWPRDKAPPIGWAFHNHQPWTPCNDCLGLGHCAQAGGCLRRPTPLYGKKKK